jgi:hypothetical protein
MHINNFGTGCTSFTFTSSAQAGIHDSIAVAFPDSIAVAFLRHAHQYHRDRLFVMHINIIGTGFTKYGFGLFINSL